MYTLYRSPAAFYEFLITVVITLLHNTATQKNFALPPVYINDLPADVICYMAIYADDTVLYSKCDQTSDLWQQQELASELESDLRDNVDWGRKWLVDFNAGKIQLVSFDWSNNTGAIHMKMDGSVFEEKSSFKMLGLTLFLNWIGALTLSILLQVPPIQLEP